MTTVSPDRLRLRVDQQIESFCAQQQSAHVRAGMLADIQARRVRRGQAAAVVVHEDRDHDHLALVDEVLVASRCLELPAVRDVLAGHALTVRRITGPLTEVAVLTAVGADLRAVVADLRAAGGRASLHHLVPLGPVIKGLGGPAAAEGPGTFAEYQISRTR